MVTRIRLVCTFAAFSFAAVALLFVGRARAETLGFGLNGSSRASASDAITVMVKDDITLSPLAGAQITIADSLGAPASSPLLTGTDGASQLPGSSSATVAITASKAGYSTVTVVGLQSQGLTIYLKPLLPMRADIIVSGMTPDLQSTKRRTESDPVHAGLVFRSMSAFDLIHFQVESFISPMQDTINIFGSRNVPSNLVAPQQDIFLLFTSVEVNKPHYRLQVVPQRPIQIGLAMGQIQTSDLVSAVQNGGNFSLDTLNNIKFDHVGVSAPVNAEDDFEQDVAAGYALNPKTVAKTAVAPFPNADILVAAVTDMTGDRSTLLPTDIKVSVNSNNPTPPRAVHLVGTDPGVGQTTDVVAIAMSDSGHRLSGVIQEQPGANVQFQAFLPAAEPTTTPTVPATVALAAPASGVGALVMEAALPFDASSSYPYWYVYALPGAGTVQVPTAQVAPGGSSSDPVRSFEIVQLDFGGSFDPGAINGETAMKKLVRFSVSSNTVSASRPAH